VTLFTLLSIIFMILKLTKVIDWNWFIIAVPFLVDLILYIVIVILGTVIEYENR